VGTIVAPARGTSGFRWRGRGQDKTCRGCSDARQLRSKEKRGRRATNEKKGANSHAEKAAQAARGGAACPSVDSGVARRVGPEAEVPRGGDNAALVVEIMLLAGDNIVAAAHCPN